MSRRPMVFVIGLTLGDYLLWNWSLNHNHDVFALIAGLAFPPLALMLLWMLAVSAAKLLAWTARRPAARSAPSAQRRPSSRPTSQPTPTAQGSSRQGSRESAPARKIAA